VAARRRSVGSVKSELVAKSREAALSAIRVFNDPLTKFKSESFIVLMMIAWTYLLHAYFRLKRMEYRYYTMKVKRRMFDRTRRGAYKYWELERCLNDDNSPIDKITANNLRFLIGLRHEIEHQMTFSLDNYLSARYQACALNYNMYLKQLFGKREGIEDQLTYSIQFMQLADEQIEGPMPAASIPPRLLAYIADFDAGLKHDEFNNPKFAYRLLFHKRLVNRAGQADRVIEFLDPSSDAAKAIDKEFWVKKEVEKPKFLAKDVVAAVQAAGFSRFRTQPEHLAMWRSEDAKKDGKGYGVMIQGIWYWYQTWIDHCIEICKAAGQTYIRQL
jgi:uncharacterized protein DUF3644